MELVLSTVMREALLLKKKEVGGGRGEWEKGRREGKGVGREDGEEREGRGSEGEKGGERVRGEGYTQSSIVCDHGSNKRQKIRSGDGLAAEFERAITYNPHFG